MTDDRLRTAFQGLSRGAVFTPDCPPAERLWAGARGELSPVEVESLAVHLADCGACAEAWRIATDFGTRAELQAPRAGLPWWLAAAAAVVVAAGASLIYIGRSPEPAGPIVATAPPTFSIAVEKAPIKVSSKYALTWRGANDGQAFLAALKTALEPYERGDYPAAVTALTALAAQYRDTTEPSLYLGVSQLLAGNGAAAVAPLEHARNLGEPDQQDEAQWYLAAAYERVGRLDDSRRMVQAVCDARRSRSDAACSVVRSGPQRR